MSSNTRATNFELPILGRLLIVVCGAYTLSWGILTLLDPKSYLQWAGIPEAQFAPGLGYWALAAIVGGLFYCGYLVSERLQFVPVPAAIVSLAGLTITLLEFYWGNLNTPALVVHSVGDASGVLGFALAAVATRQHHRKAP